MLRAGARSTAAAAGCGAAARLRSADAALRAAPRRLQPDTWFAAGGHNFRQVYDPESKVRPIGAARRCLAAARRSRGAELARSHARSATFSRT